MFFSAVNAVPGIVRRGEADTAYGGFAAPGHAEGAAVEVVIRPQHLRIDFDRNGSGPLPTPQDGVPARGRVLRARFVGDQSVVEVGMEHDGSVLRATLPGAFLPRPGTPLWLSLRRDRSFVFPRSGPDATAGVA